MRVPKGEPLGILLYRCIRDEVQVTAPTLRVALHQLARERHRELHFGTGWVVSILRGKFGAIFREVVEQSYLEGGSNFEKYNDTLTDLALHFQFGNEEPLMSDAVVGSLRNTLATGSRLDKIYAALVCMWLAYSSQDTEAVHFTEAERQDRFQVLYPGLSGMLVSNDWPCALAASWALAWIGESKLLSSPPEPNTILSLFRLWHQAPSMEQGRYPAWALAALPLLPRDTFSKEDWGDCDSFLREAVMDQSTGRRTIKTSALVVAWYRRGPWSDDELVEQLAIDSKRFNYPSPTARTLLQSLGDAGLQTLKDWERKMAER